MRLGLCNKTHFDFLLGVVNFEFVKGSISDNLGEANLVNSNICTENLDEKQKTKSMMDEINLPVSTNLNNPLTLTNSVDDGRKVKLMVGECTHKFYEDFYPLYFEIIGQQASVAFRTNSWRFVQNCRRFGER